MRGYDRGEARASIRRDVDRVLETWRNPRNAVGSTVPD